MWHLLCLGRLCLGVWGDYGPAAHLSDQMFFSAADPQMLRPQYELLASPFARETRKLVRGRRWDENKFTSSTFIFEKKNEAG